MRTLPDFPWDALSETTRHAAAHPDGLVDLSMGGPVDDVPENIRQALEAGADKPGYPSTHGTPELREAAVDALRRRYGITDVPAESVFPTIGSKELIAWLPSLLGLGADDTVVIPELAYPTYEVGARLADAQDVRADATHALGPARPALLWLNSPSNPTGKVLPAEHMRKVVDWARERGTIVASDECYLSLGWGTEPVSVLHPDVCGGSFQGLLAVHSLSKSANFAGYRGGLVTGDPEIVARLLQVRRHAGLIVPRPIQQAMTVSLRDDEHIRIQRERYARRRERLLPALRDAGFRVEHSEAGLYLWVTRDEPAQATVDWLADRGILVAPGTFYGPRGRDHVRLSLTATDERVIAAVNRLRS